MLDRFGSEFGTCNMGVSELVALWAEVRAYLIDGLLVHLHAVNGEPWACVQLFMANVAFKVLCLLVLYQDLVIVELAVTVPAPTLLLRRLLLLTAHVVDALDTISSGQ